MRNVNPKLRSCFRGPVVKASRLHREDHQFKSGRKQTLNNNIVRAYKQHFFFCEGEWLRSVLTTCDSLQLAAHKTHHSNFLKIKPSFAITYNGYYQAMKSLNGSYVELPSSSNKLSCLKRRSW